MPLLRVVRVEETKETFHLQIKFFNLDRQKARVVFWHCARFFFLSRICIGRNLRRQLDNETTDPRVFESVLSRCMSEHVFQGVVQSSASFQIQARIWEPVQERKML